MKAVLWTKYGPPNVLQPGEAAKPIPKDNEVLIKIHATTVTAGDCEVRNLSFNFFLSTMMRAYAGLVKPKRVTILGQELSGEIESVGRDVIRFRTGDQVFAGTGFAMGAYAEYICLPENPKPTDGVLATKPANMTFEEAACVPTGGLEALHFLRKANIQRGEKVLIIGAGGSIGTIGIQLAKHFGGVVTGIDRAEKLDMLLSVGADYVIDYTKDDFTTNGETYDVIFDVVGKSSISRRMDSLAANGRYLMANPRLSQLIRGDRTSKKDGKKVVAGQSGRTTEDLEFLRELIEAGKIKSVIDRRYPLDQVAKAHSYVESGLKTGNVVIDVEHSV